MTINSDGSAECDSCGGDIENAAIDKAVSVHLFTANNEPLTLHLGIICKKRCADKVLSSQAFAHRQATAPFQLYGRISS